MDHWQYLIVLAACLLITAPLEMFGPGVYRQAGAPARAVLPVAAVFVAWDAVAIAAHVWTYNPQFVTGLELPGRIPIEELLFFIVIPLCGLLDLLRRRHHPDSDPQDPVPIEAVAVTGLGYTLPAVLAVIALCALEFGVLHTGLFRRPAYWISMVIVFAFQITRRRLADEAVGTDRHLRRQSHQRHQVPVRHPGRGFPVRLRAGDRRAAAVGTPASARQEVRGRAMTDRKAEVPAAFDAGAAAYDGLVGANPGYHRHLLMSARRIRLGNDGRGLRLLDAGCGTGASTAALLAVAPARRDRRGRRVVGHAGRGRRQALAVDRAVRAQPHRGHRRSRRRRAVRRDPRRVPAAQPRRPRRPVAHVPDTAAAGRRRWPCTSTRCATPAWPRRCGTPCARRSSSRWAGCAAATPGCTATCGAASTTSTVRRPSETGCRPTASPSVRSETVPGWQRNIVHTFLGEAPR